MILPVVCLVSSVSKAGLVGLSFGVVLGGGATVGISSATGKYRLYKVSKDNSVVDRILGLNLCAKQLSEIMNKDNSVPQSKSGQHA